MLVNDKILLVIWTDLILQKERRFCGEKLTQVTVKTRAAMISYRIFRRERVHDRRSGQYVVFQQHLMKRNMTKMWTWGC